MQKLTLNAQARRLRTAIETALGQSISHSQAQHLTAQAHGFPNWQTARARTADPNRGVAASSTHPGPQWLITRTEDDEITPWLISGSEADAHLWIMTLVLPYTLERLTDDEAVDLITAYRERRWEAFMRLFSVATSGDVVYTVTSVPTEVQPTPTPLDGARLTALLNEHHPIPDGTTPEAFICACGESVPRGDSFYEDEDGQHCMDCGMDIQDRGVRGSGDEQRDEDKSAEEDAAQGTGGDQTSRTERYLNAIVTAFLADVAASGASLDSDSSPVQVHYNATHRLLNIVRGDHAENVVVRGADVTDDTLTLHTGRGPVTLRAHRDAAAVEVGKHYAPGDTVGFMGRTDNPLTVVSCGSGIVTTHTGGMIYTRDATLLSLAPFSSRGFLPGDRVAFKTSAPGSTFEVARIRAHHIAPLVTFTGEQGETWADDLRLVTRRAHLTDQS
ncbi:glyoxalase superfamily protein [Deinococcus soli (ex Cha et al. 2016)]|uniref:Uncharacterized protein n=2 Tax=Deinococcus soli (ex Cha et al. 2016) TaxID=1309411 RepID=A0ACC6KHG9_9DEIO|nr:glyoxalase superfamily protein [Deinococcus soli (ex Cha et al. 2016)]MDR6218870.1 hypothetical protein [Deinococcus soli (ex Cha et al. 2016)]MDR6328667.1 hypothetical protein [Deinococcus soli (ex Cha et al. 2016)]MDR6751846.1 hypothetical protein [Deinococcus soli (ex Cha et al. 2016)]